MHIKQEDDLSLKILLVIGLFDVIFLSHLNKFHLEIICGNLRNFTVINSSQYLLQTEPGIIFAIFIPMMIFSGFYQNFQARKFKKSINGGS